MMRVPEPAKNVVIPVIGKSPFLIPIIYKGRRVIKIGEWNKKDLIYPQTLPVLVTVFPY
jgi:hypothetical protein